VNSSIRKCNWKNKAICSPLAPCGPGRRYGHLPASNRYSPLSVGPAIRGIEQRSIPAPRRAHNGRTITALGFERNTCQKRAPCPRPGRGVADGERFAQRMGAIFSDHGEFTAPVPRHNDRLLEAGGPAGREPKWQHHHHSAMAPPATFNPGRNQHEKCYVLKCRSSAAESSRRVRDESAEEHPLTCR